MISFLASAPRSRRQVQARLQARQHCPLCEGTEANYAFAYQQMRVSHCTGCELIRLERRPGQPARANREEPADSARNAGKPRLDPSPLLHCALDRINARLGQASSSPVALRLACVGFALSDVERVAGALGMSVAAFDATPLIRDYAFDTPSVPDDARALAACDACLLAVPLETFNEPVKALHAIHRLLKPAGALIVLFESLIPSQQNLQSGRLQFSQDAAFVYNEETASSVLFRAGYGQVNFSWHQPARGEPAWSPRRPRGSQAPALAIVSKRYAEDPENRRSRLSIIMPVFNEKSTFLEIFELLYAKQLPNLDKEIIIVESNSTDGTKDIVQSIANRPGVEVVWQDRPRGKGYAVREGLSRAKGDFVLIQDADLEYDIDDYDLLLDPLFRNRAAFVLGIRHGRHGNSWKMRHFKDQAVVSQVMNIGHVFFTTLFNVVYGQHLSDPFTMFKVFRRDCVHGVKFECDRFDFDWELVAKIVRRGYTPVEIPVNYTSRSFTEGKKVTFFRDPMTWLRACIKYRFVKV